MDIKITGEIQVKDFFNEIVIIDGENTIRIPVQQAKNLVDQLEGTLFDETESHKYKDKKIDRLEKALYSKENAWCSV